MDTMALNAEKDSLLRQLSFFVKLGDGTPSKLRDAKKLTAVVNEMTSIYAKATVNHNHLDPEITEIMATSRNATELAEYYIGWRRANYPSRRLYAKFVERANAAARESRYEDMGVLWRSDFDMSAREYSEMVERVLDQLMPLYESLHCYAHGKLNKFYGDDVVDLEDPLIPAHLLGNMWSQDWGEIADILRPYPDLPGIDITPELKKQGYDAVGMHRLAESFYTSIGLEPLPATFWEDSMLSRPVGREAVCHASAWNFGTSQDSGEPLVRIKQCTEATQSDFETCHHEQGHLQYFLAYRKQPYVFREGAADFFHEAIGDAIMFSALNPAHLRDDLHLLPKGSSFDSPESVLNTQLTMALGKVAITPFAYLIDRFRWDLFAGKVSFEDANVYYADLIRKYQGLRYPAGLDPKTKGAFDPPAKFHISANVPYTRYFLAAALSFQLHRGLCKAVGHTGPLHECSVFGRKEAGAAYLKMLSLGRSKVWQEALVVATGEDTVDGDAMIEYFEPLRRFLDESNKGKKCGWKV